MPGNFSADGSKHVLGRGAVLFNRFVEGTRAGPGLRFLGNVSEFTVGASDEVQERRSSTSDSAPLVDAVPTRRNIEITATLTEFDPHNLALAFMGTQETASQGSAVGVSELFENVEQGLSYKLPHFNVSSVTVLVGVTVKTLGTDYLVELATGLVTVVIGGTINDGDDLTVGYSHAAIASIQRVKGGVAGAIEGELMFRSDNAIGSNFLFRAWRVSIQPDGETGFIADEYGAYSIRMRVLDDSPNHPGEGLFTIETFEGLEV